MRSIILKKLKIIMCIIIISLVLIYFQINFEKFNEDINNIRLDKRNGLNQSIILENIVNEMPYLPIEDLINFQHKKNRNINGSCAPHPSLADIHIQNEYWQEFLNVNITYYIFGAYLDVRPRVVKDEPLVRVLTMANFISTTTKDYPKIYCQLWYEEQSAPIIVPTKDLLISWKYNTWGHASTDHYGHLISCVLPEEHKDWIPKTVSLVSQPCERATNLMRVTYIPLKDGEVKQRFAVCVKGLDFPYVDLSNRLVEYLETVRSLGATKVLMYNLQVHPNMTKVIKYYEETGFVEYRPFTFSLKFGNLPHYRHMEMSQNNYAHVKQEIIPYTDCLYRNMYLYEYVANIDIDEIPLPLGEYNNWYDIMELGERVTSKNCKEYASFCFRCVTFPTYPEKPRYSDEFPEYFYMLQHVHRVTYHFDAGSGTKCLHNTNLVIDMHNHYSLHWASDVCRDMTFNVTDGQLQHYRPINLIFNPTVKAVLNSTIVDKSLWRLKDEIIKRCNVVFNDLHYFDNSLS